MKDISSLLNNLVGFYGESEILPSRTQWEAVLNNDNSGSVVIINYMKIRETAAYPDGSDTDISGMDAMMRYFEISQKKVADHGGEFVIQGLFGSVVIGDDEDWDAIGIVRYPNKDAFVALFLDQEYREGHHHRVAATLRHKMILVMEA
jgi:uncharacterized protein (DUF1330 family)